jgi:SAM-dependent methyltransferase
MVMAAVQPVEVGTVLPVKDEAPLVKLDLGCGQSKADGFQGVDAYEAPGVDVVHDLLEFPWPFADKSVDEVRSSHFLEHVPGQIRLRFFAELWRVMKTGGKALFITPSADSNRAVQDPTHEWPPVVGEFYFYLSRDWRALNKLTHGAYSLAGDCNFEPVVGVAFDPQVAARPDEFRTFAMKHYRNATYDMHVTLTRLD